MNIILLIRSLKPTRIEHYLLLSILLYQLGDFLGYNMTTTVERSIKCLGFLLFVYLLVVKSKYLPFRGWPMLLFSLLLIDVVWITLCTFFFNGYGIEEKSLYEKGFSIMFSQYFLPSIMPFMLLLFNSKKHIDMRYFIRLMTVLSLVYLCLYPFAFYNMLNYRYDLSLGFGEEGGYGDFINKSNFHITSLAVPAILYYFRKYLPNKLWWLFFAVSIGELLIALYTARRGRSVTLLLYYLSCYILYYVNKRTSKVWLLIMGIIVVILGFLIIKESSSGFLSLLFERGVEDTRSNVELAFYTSMDTYSWIWGRGWFGQYYDFIFREYRTGMETGYLTLILRGGLVYLFLYVTVLLFSGLRGLFCSKSIFVKAFAIMILMSIFELYPFGWPTFNFKFYVIWIGVFICNSPYYLRLKDRKIKTIL